MRAAIRSGLVPPLLSNVQQVTSTVELGEALPELHIATPDRQRRWTVLLRAVLTIPHLIVLFALAIAAMPVLVIGWFGALVLGRLPGWCAEFLTGYVAWTIRTTAYLYLLTDTYPPFGWTPVGIGLPSPGRLNRLAVLFRLVLGFPAAIVLLVASYGWAMLAFFFWLLTLVLGRTPVPIRDAGVALLRYDLRVYAYTYLLTPAYPKHLLRLPTGGRTLLIILIVLGALGYPATITAEVLATPLSLTQTVHYRPVLDVMLKQADASEINDNVVRALQALPHVESVVYNSPEQSYEQAKRVFADDSDLVQTLKPEDFPPLYQVTVDDESAVAHIEAVAKSLPGVDRVQRIA